MLNACIICHKKKVKCDLASQHPCSNCIKSDVDCIRYKRKRKRYTNSLSPRDSRAELYTPPIPPSPQCRAQESPQLTITGDGSKPEHAIQTYRARDRYLGRHVSFNESMITANAAKRDCSLTDIDVQLLTQQGAYTLPPPDVQNELVAIFMRFGYIWTPIVDPSWLSGQPVSYLLLQSLFVAASRMTRQPNRHASSAEFYRRAKLLFFFGNERDPIILIASAILLHWYNPVGPETISTDTSGFWLRTAEAIAFQIGLHKEPPLHEKHRGLRRRLWWTLVLRDCIIAAGVGRPRTINLSDSDVLPPSLDDFAVPDINARIFIVYVPICQFLGEIVENCLRPQLPPNQRALENCLYRWVKQDLPSIQPPQSTGSLETRQVMVMYFVTIIIIDRAPTTDGVPSARSLIASSFISGMFRIFLENDELCRLGAAFTFYALCAGLALIPAYRFLPLRAVANEETLVLKASLQVLSQQWGSAFGSLRALQRLTDDVANQPIFDKRLPHLTDDVLPFFENFDWKICRLREMLLDSNVYEPSSVNPQPSIPSTVGQGGPFATSQTGRQEPFEIPSDELDMFIGNWEGLGFDWSGSWLLESM
ncbi:hypothetical protein BDV59DRAFT_209132 [Aspergillus ambiguus]|uniref:transcription factor domain-containing protein n=1 Tax=Aspergillus ambiguus TaxID=176160 RepID=UPI003CCD71B2